MTVLALESDPTQAATVRHIVCDRVLAKLTLVQSIDQAVAALQTDTPDLILLPALVSPAEEAALLTSLRTLPNSAHVQILITPVLGAPEEPATPRGWRRWGSRRPLAAPPSTHELDLFAERLGWSLERARQRPQHIEECNAPNDTGTADTPNHVASAPDLNAPQVDDTARPLLVPDGESSRPHSERIEATMTEAKTMWPREEFDTVRLLPAGDDSNSLNLTRNANHQPVDQVTKVVVDTSSQKRRLPDTTTAAEPGPCLVHGLHTNRRAHRRFLPRELLGGAQARIKFGPTVSLLDLSAGGALIETEARLRPESEAVLELGGDLRHIIVPFRVVRCQVSALNGSLRYRGACDFTRELDLADLVLPSAVAEVADTPIDPPERMDFALETILEPYLRPADGGAVTPQSLSRRQATELVKLLQTVSHRRSVDPMAWAIHGVVALLTAALQQDEGSAAWTSVEAHLRNVLRGLTAGSADAPACVPPLDTEALYFQVPTRRGDAGRVLNVAIAQGGMLEDWQFRLPKASTWLAALPGTTREGGTGGPGGRAERRRDVRVTGPFDGRRHGAIDTPVLIHNLSEGGCFVDSLLQAEAGHQLSLGVSVPGEGWITVKGEVVHGQPGFGFAVRFVEVSDATRACLARVVARCAGSVASDLAPEQMAECNAW